MTDIEKEAASCRFFFRKENRLLKRADFLRVYAHGKVYRRGLVHVFILKEAPVSDADDSASGKPIPTRLGVTATRKVGKAVRRNRARRLIRESFRMTLPWMNPGYSMVVNVTRATTAAPFTKVNAQLQDIWREAGVLSGDRPYPQKAPADSR